MIESNDTSDYTFLQALFGDEIGQVQVCDFLFDPQNIPPDQRGFAWHTHLWQDHRGFDPLTNRFFCISLFHLGADDQTGQPKVQRRRNLHRKTCVIALDDVVEKLDPTVVATLPRPTAILETSPGSHQWFYRVTQDLFNPYSMDQVENLQDGLVASDLCPSGKDPGLKNVTRLVRLPSGYNTKARNVDFMNPNGAKCQLLELNPEIEVTLEEIAAPLNIDINAARRATSVGMGTEDANHPLAQVLDILSSKGGGCYEVTCPWIDNPEHGHTNPEDNSGTTVQLFADGNGNLDCRHGHNEIINGRKPLMAWAATQPGWDQFVSDYASTPSEFTQPSNAVAFAGYQGIGDLPPVDVGGVAYVAEPKAFLDEALCEALDSIRAQLVSIYNSEDGPAQAQFDTQPFIRTWNEAFYSPAKKSTFMLNREGVVVQAPDTKVQAFIEHIQGPVVSRSALAILANAGVLDANGIPASNDVIKRLITSIFKTFKTSFEAKRQRNNVSYEVDMFNEKSVMDVQEGRVDIVLSHTPFAVKVRPAAEVVAAVVADYREHFPQFDEFIESIAAARFAGNARKAYSWLHASSSWGKTFLLNGVLGSGGLNLVSGCTVKEIEKIFSGSPIGKSQSDFIRSWILFVDEVRYLTGDIKQLDHEISGSPKNQLSFKAKVYSKIFCSAFAMDSLSGDTGVEAQFCSRFSYLRPELGVRLEDRAMFQQMGATAYRLALAAWCADYLNSFVDSMRGLGDTPRDSRLLAENHCDHILTAYHDKNNIGDHLGSMSDTLKDYADELSALVVAVSAGFDGRTALTGLSQATRDVWTEDRIIRGYHAKYGEVVLLKSPSKLIKAWLIDQVSRSEIVSLMASAHDVLTMLDAEGKGSRRVRLSHEDGSSGLYKGAIILVK